MKLANNINCSDADRPALEHRGRAQDWDGQECGGRGGGLNPAVVLGLGGASSRG